MQFCSPLHLRQVFDPLLAWARDTLGAELAVDDSIFGANQPSEAIQTLRRHLEGAQFINPTQKWLQQLSHRLADTDGIHASEAYRQIPRSMHPGSLCLFPQLLHMLAPCKLPMVWELVVPPRPGLITPAVPVRQAWMHGI